MRASGGADTVSTTLVRVLAAELGNRLTAPGRRYAERLAGCAEGVQSSLESNGWEEVFRYAVTAAPACGSLLDELIGTSQGNRRSFAQRLINRARSLSGGTWVDGLLAGAKTVVALR